MTGRETCLQQCEEHIQRIAAGFHPACRIRLEYQILSEKLLSHYKRYIDSRRSKESQNHLPQDIHNEYHVHFEGQTCRSTLWVLFPPYSQFSLML